MNTAKLKYGFSDETNLIIMDFEKKLEKEKKEISKITKNKLKFINKLISRYNEILEIAKNNTNLNKIVIINGRKSMISKYDVRNSDIKQIKRAIQTNSFDNKAEYKRVECNGSITRKKRYKPYRIKRLARLLKAAKETDYNLFQNFIKIPDVNYALEVIRKNEFGDLDIFMGKRNS